MSELWQGVLTQLRERLGVQNFDTWVKPIRVRETTDEEITLEVPNKFFRDWLSEHFLGAIHECFASPGHKSLKVSMVVTQKLQSAVAPAEKKAEREPARAPRVNNLIPKYNFENFVVGASNQFAHAASLAVANQPGEHYNPLFIYGGGGPRKKHPIKPIGHRILQKTGSPKGALLRPQTLTEQTI